MQFTIRLDSLHHANQRFLSEPDATKKIEAIMRAEMARKIYGDVRDTAAEILDLLYRADYGASLQDGPLEQAVMKLQALMRLAP